MPPVLLVKRSEISTRGHDAFPLMYDGHVTATSSPSSASNSGKSTVIHTSRLCRGNSISPGLSANSDDAYDLSTTATRKRLLYEQCARADTPHNTPTFTPQATQLVTPTHRDNLAAFAAYSTHASPFMVTSPAMTSPSPPHPLPPTYPLLPTAKLDHDTITPLETFLRNAQMVDRYRELTLHLAEMTRIALLRDSNGTNNYNNGLSFPGFPSPASVAATAKPYREELFPPTNSRHAILDDVDMVKSSETEHRKGGVSAKDGGRRFTCDRCPKSYSTVGALKMHVRTHTLPCRCTVCGKAFSRPWLLQGHMRTHTGEKPFSCEHCQRAFADRSNLRAHLQTHSAVKRYRCTSCQKTFSRMSLLLKHQQTSCPNHRY